VFLFVKLVTVFKSWYHFDCFIWYAKSFQILFILFPIHFFTNFLFFHTFILYFFIIINFSLWHFQILFSIYQLMPFIFNNLLWLFKNFKFEIIKITIFLLFVQTFQNPFSQHLFNPSSISVFTHHFFFEFWMDFLFIKIYFSWILDIRIRKTVIGDILDWMGFLNRDIWLGHHDTLTLFVNFVSMMNDHMLLILFVFCWNWMKEHTLMKLIIVWLVYHRIVKYLTAFIISIIFPIPWFRLVFYFLTILHFLIKWGWFYFWLNCFFLFFLQSFIRKLIIFNLLRFK